MCVCKNGIMFNSFLKFYFSTASILVIKIIFKKISTWYVWYKSIAKKTKIIKSHMDKYFEVKDNIQSSKYSALHSKKIIPKYFLIEQRF